MLNKIIFILISVIFSFCSCKTGKSEEINLASRGNLGKGTKIEELEIIRITQSTWDRESSIVVSYKSELIHKKMPNIEDYLFNDTLTISMEAVRYVEDFIDKNQKDSVKGKLDGRQTFLKISLYGKSESVDFYMQPKTDNDFLKRLADTVQKSKHGKECIRLISILKEFDNVNKKSKGN